MPFINQPHILLLVIVMCGVIVALVISVMMIALVIYKGNSIKFDTIYCSKSEMLAISESIPDDCIIEIRIGRNTYDNFPDRNNHGRNLRNNISE